MGNFKEYARRLFYIDYGTLDEENCRIVKEEFLEEEINRVNVISAIACIGEAILMILDFLSGFFRKNPLNHLNLLAEIIIIISSLVINYLCNKMVKKEYRNQQARARLMQCYKLFLLLAVCIFVFTDIYVRHKVLGSYIVFLFIYQVIPDYKAIGNIAVFVVISFFIIVFYLSFVPNAQGGSLFSILVIIFAFGFSTECMRAYSIKKTVGNRMNELMKERFANLASETILALSNAVEAKDLYTKGHSQRVARYSVELARRLGYDQQQQKEIYYIGLLHDIGKIGIADQVINKNGRLSDEEYKEIQKHPDMGYDILKIITEIPGISIGARWHHEKFDGSGYPDRLKGNQIPEVARIIAMADAYDAMTSNRSYREVMPQKMVRNEIEKNMGTQFAPEIAKIMLEMMDEDKEYKMRAIAD